MPLPADLVNAINEHRWYPPQDPEIYERVFGDVADTPEFYDLRGIELENRAWQAMTGAAIWWTPEADRSLGIDLPKSVAIASLGPDKPAVLDYRSSADNPRVLYLGFQGKPIWVEVAPDINSLLGKLGL